MSPHPCHPCLRSIHHEEISRLEHGEKSPQAPTIHKLSQALEIELERFVDNSPIGLELLTTQEAGQRLNVPTARVRAWMKQGVLPGVKVSGECACQRLPWPNWSAVAGCGEHHAVSTRATGADPSRTPETLWEQSAKREGGVHLAPRLLSSIY